MCWKYISTSFKRNKTVLLRCIFLGVVPSLSQCAATVGGRSCLIVGLVQSRVVMMAALVASEASGATNDDKIYIKSKLSSLAVPKWVVTTSDSVSDDKNSLVIFLYPFHPGHGCHTLNDVHNVITLHWSAITHFLLAITVALNQVTLC